MRRRRTEDIIVLCDQGCEKITTGEAMEIHRQTRDEPAEWAGCCSCGEREYFDLEHEFNSNMARRLLDKYQELENSSDYEDRMKAEGFYLAVLEVIT